MKSPFGWSLPPGCHSLPGEDEDDFCEMCYAVGTGNCCCPECLHCHAVGDPKCYGPTGHGLDITLAQIESRTEFVRRQEDQSRAEADEEQRMAAYQWEDRI